MPRVFDRNDGARLRLSGRDGWYCVRRRDLLIPEVQVSVQEVGKVIEDAYTRGKTHAIIINAEGSGHNTTELANALEAMDVGFTTRVTVLGHIQRGGSPTAYDRLLASRMGVKAVDALLEGKSGVMTGLKGNDIEYIPIEDVIGNKRTVNLEYYQMTKMFARSVVVGSS